jgi:hypothetical protein
LHSGELAAGVVDLVKQLERGACGPAQMASPFIASSGSWPRMSLLGRFSHARQALSNSNRRRTKDEIGARAKSSRHVFLGSGREGLPSPKSPATFEKEPELCKEKV